MSRRRGGELARKRKAFVFEREGGCCYYCSRKVRLVGWSWPPPKYSSDDATLDHIIPHSLGGTTRLDNVVLACRECNETRDTMPFEEFVQIRVDNHT